MTNTEKKEYVAAVVAGMVDGAHYIETVRRNIAAKPAEPEAPEVDFVPVLMALWTVG